MSIFWSKLGTPDVIAVALPSPTAAVGPASAGPARFVVEVVAAADPDGDVGPPPAPATLASLCRAHLPSLQPGFVALLAGGAPLDTTALTVDDGGLRLGGAAVDDRPFALLRITLAGPAIELDDPAAADALTDLGDRRRRLLAAYARDDRDAIDAAFRDVLAGIAAEPRLDDRARKRLVAGFASELTARRKAGLGAIPRAVRGWTDFVADLPPVAALGAYDLAKILRDLPRPATVDPGDGLESMTVAAEPPPVHWNTRVLDGDQPILDQPVIVGHVYRIETKLDPAPAADAQASTTIADGAVEDGTVVGFVVECRQPVLRAPGTEAWVARVEGTAAYQRDAGGTEPVAVELQPSAAGPLGLLLSLRTRNAVRASTRVALLAVEAAPAGAPTLAPSPASEPSPAVEVAGAALAGPGAAIRFELTPADQIVLAIDPVVGRPVSTRNPAALATAAIAARKALVALSKTYEPDPARAPFGLIERRGGKPVPAGTTMLELARIGEALHRAVFGRPGDDDDLNRTRLAQTIADVPADPRGVRMQIAAAFQPFPWAVFYDASWRGALLTDDPASVDPAGFWGRRFRIDRALVTGHGMTPSRSTIRGPLRVQACLNPNLDRQQGVAVIDGQRALFAALAGVVARAPIEREQDLRDYLRSQPAACDLLYFFCHAHAAETRDDLFTYRDKPPERQARLVIDADGGLDVQAMEELRAGPLADRPLVFLNACSSVAGDEAYQPQLLLQFLGRWKAAGVIGTDWKVPTLFADAFARCLLGYFLGDREPLAAAFAHATADAFAAGNPFPLIYALYAPPDLTFQPGATS